MFHFK